MALSEMAADSSSLSEPDERLLRFLESDMTRGFVAGCVTLLLIWVSNALNSAVLDYRRVYGRKYPAPSEVCFAS